MFEAPYGVRTARSIRLPLRARRISYTSTPDLPTVKFDLTQTRFLTSAAAREGYPHDRGGEVAFAGRSNAGKSSAMNTLTGINGLARKSKTPGRTQLVNFFEVHPEIRLVDLPGYGFAQVPDAVRRGWRAMLEDYLTTRESLRGVVLVMDIRHPLTEFDQQFLEWTAHLGIPIHIILTKADKLARGVQARTLQEVQRALPPGTGVTVFSATAGTGRDELRRQLETWLRPVGNLA
jgi:GTP-binding protein